MCPMMEMLIRCARFEEFIDADTSLEAGPEPRGLLQNLASPEDLYDRRL